MQESCLKMLVRIIAYLLQANNFMQYGVCSIRVFYCHLVVRRIDGDGSGEKSICDSIDQSLCQLINYTTTIHIELTLSMECNDENIQNDIQCDIDEALSAALEDLTETSNTIMSCTAAVNNSGMDCRVMITALDNSTVSQTLTQQLYKLLMNNRTLVMVSTLGTLQANRILCIIV